MSNTNWTVSTSSAPSSYRPTEKPWTVNSLSGGSRPSSQTVRIWSSFSYRNSTRSGHCVTSIMYGSYWRAGDAEGTQSYLDAIASSNTA